jgi:mannose-6-phosphate isomerase
LLPQFVPRIWGARSLAPLFPEKENLAEPIGEVWLTGNECVFADGPFAGRALGDAWRAMPPEWAGTRLDTSKPFPLLVKFLFPEDILSIQVHPDDEYARQHEAHTGWTGKTEMWHAIAARPGAEVLVGLKEDVTPESFRAAIADGTAEKCLNRIPVAPGDTIFVPAGTVHTIGPGSVLCEIQENSDLTYRVYDYGRRGPDGKPRPLHIDKALDVARFGAQAGGKVEPVRVTHANIMHTFYLSCRNFATEKIEFTERVKLATEPERFELLIVLEGNGRIESHGVTEEFERSQVWLLPASLGTYELAASAPCTVLRTYVPNVERFTAQLRAAGASENAASRIVFP